MTQEQANTQNVKGDLVPVSQWNKHFDYPSVGAIRQYIFYKSRNGFEKCVRYLGKRQYISVSAFNEWVNERHEYTCNFQKEWGYKQPAQA